MQPDVVGLLVLAVCVVLFVTKALPSPVVGTMGCLLMVLFGAATFEEAFSGFSSSIVLLMASAMIVGIAMFKTGTAQVIGRCIIRWARGSESIFLFSTCLTAGVMAMFLANTMESPGLLTGGLLFPGRGFSSRGVTAVTPIRDF